MSVVVNDHLSASSDKNHIPKTHNQPQSNNALIESTTTPADSNDHNNPSSDNEHQLMTTSNENNDNGTRSNNDQNVVQENGQRKWGPPADWTGPPPPKRGTEVFVGKLPRDLNEQHLLPVLQQAGRVYELRLMIDFSGANRGYCFATYASKEEAKSACQELNNFEIRPGKHIGVVISIDNCRLFVGGIPRERNRDEIFGEISKLVEGVRDVILYPSANDKAKNRGFAFVEFETHKQAAQARRKLFAGRVQLWGQPICVDWAEPEQEVDDQTMSQVKVLYIRNLMLSTTEESIKDKFETIYPGSVERVKKLKDFAFVHFTDRQYALETLEALNGTFLDGAKIEVQLSKPPDKTIMRYVKNAQKTSGVGLGAGSGAGMGSVGNPQADLMAAAAQTYLQNHQQGLANLALAQSGSMVNDPLTWAYTGTPLIHASHQTPAPTPIIPETIYGSGAVRHNHRGAAGMRGAGFQAHVNKQVRNARRRTSDQASLMYELYPYPTMGGLLWLPTTGNNTVGNGGAGGVGVGGASMAAAGNGGGGGILGGGGQNSSTSAAAAAAATAAALNSQSATNAAGAAAILAATNQQLQLGTGGLTAAGHHHHMTTPAGHHHHHHHHTPPHLSSLSPHLNPIPNTTTKKASVQLEEYCRDRNWGKPIFETTANVTKTIYGPEVTLYVSKVTIPILAATVGSFQPNRPWTDEEEAKEFAALFALIQLTAPAFCNIGDQTALYAAASGVIQAGGLQLQPPSQQSNIH